MNCLNALLACKQSSQKLRLNIIIYVIVLLSPINEFTWTMPFWDELDGMKKVTKWNQAERMLKVSSERLLGYLILVVSSECFILTVALVKFVLFNGSNFFSLNMRPAGKISMLFLVNLGNYIKSRGEEFT